MQNDQLFIFNFSNLTQCRFRYCTNYAPHSICNTTLICWSVPNKNAEDKVLMLLLFHWTAKKKHFKIWLVRADYVEHSFSQCLEAQWWWWFNERNTNGANPHSSSTEDDLIIYGGCAPLGTIQTQACSLNSCTHMLSHFTRHYKI